MGVLTVLNISRQVIEDQNRSWFQETGQAWTSLVAESSVDMLLVEIVYAGFIERSSDCVI